MSWLQPWMWMSAVAVALPIAVHLISQRPPRTTPFPSLRFLTSTRLRPARHRQPSDWPLLLLRIAIVLAAVAAMAQPVWRTASAPSSMTRAIVVDTSAAAVTPTDTLRDSTARQAGGARLVVPTASVRAVLPGVVAWLRTQPTPRELVVLADVQRGMMDRADFSALPLDVRVRFGPRARASVPPRAQAAAAVVIAAAGQERLATWLTQMQPLPTTPARRWMAERIAMLQRDSLLVSAAWATTPVQDTIIRAPVQVVATTATGAPVVLAAVITADRTTDMGASAVAAPRLLLWTRTDSTSRVAAALQLVTTASPRETATVAAAIAPDTLRAWAIAPSAAPIGAGVGTERDPLTAPSDARLLWLLVLILLGAETLVRRRG